MELQYRTSFLDLTWDTIDSYNFIYGGGLGSHEGNEHTFRISDKGQYRVKILGQVSFIGGHHDVLMYSGLGVMRVAELLFQTSQKLNN